MYLVGSWDRLKHVIDASSISYVAHLQKCKGWKVLDVDQGPSIFLSAKSQNHNFENRTSVKYQNPSASFTFCDMQQIQNAHVSRHWC